MYFCCDGSKKKTVQWGSLPTFLTVPMSRVILQNLSLFCANGRFTGRRATKGDGMGLWKKFFGRRQGQPSISARLESYEKEMESTRRRCEEQLKLNPQDARAYYDRARCFKYEQLCDEAIEDLDKAISLDPQFADAWYLRGELKADKKDYRQAAVDAQESLRINPKSYNATYLLGRAHFELQMLPEALAQFEKCEQLDPEVLNHRFQIRKIREILLSGAVRPLNLWSNAVLSVDDMLELQESLKTAPILAAERIRKEVQPEKLSDAVEGHLSQILERLTEYVQEDGRRPDFIGVRANWVGNEYVNVSTWFRPPQSSQAATAWMHLIVRKGEDVYCLFA